jgi:NADH:ubiquinone oxidoreductase subunit 5 (subunit L)/multisubunit Na+/H+ antiporter MnhA subunit
LIGCIGLVTLILSTAYARTRSDAKTVLIAASQAQVGGIYILIALGFYLLATWVTVGHASLRTWQILRASSLIQDFQDNLSIFRWVTQERHHMSNKKLYLLLRESFYIEKTFDWIVLTLVKNIQKLPNSFTAQVFIAFLTIFSSLVFQSSIIEQKVFFLIPILFLSVISISANNIRYAIYGTLISVFLHIWIGQMGDHTNQALFLSISLFEAPLIGLFAYWSERLLSEFPNQLNLNFYGLGEKHPQAFAFMSIASLLISGAPIGLTFFFEEVVFHNTFSSNITVTLLTILIVGLNTVTLVKSTFRLFGGKPIIGIKSPKMTVYEKWTSGLILSFYLFSMVNPQPVLIFLEHLLKIEGH